MTAIAGGRVEPNTNSLQISDNGGKRRTCNNKYWNLLFIVLLIVWLALGRDVVVRRQSDCQINSDDSTASSNGLLRFFTNKTDCNSTSENRKIFVTNLIEDVPKVWGKYWLFDVITCNIGFLDEHYEESGSIVTWAHILMSFCLITYATTSMRTDRMFYLSLRQFPMVIFLVTYFYRFIYYTSLVNPKNHIEVLPSEINVLWWIAPELILLCIRATVKLPRKRDVQKNSGQDSVSERYFRFSFHVLVYSHLFFLPLCFIISSVSNKYELNWENNLSAYLFIAISCYFCLIIHYFGLLVTSCATGLSLDLDRKSYNLGDCFRAWIIVARYHFGTVCYHATLILPRIQATFVMNQKEFRDVSSYSTIYRFYLTHWRIHDLTLMMTASRGPTYSESIEELLRFFISNSSKTKIFQTHGQIVKRGTAFLMALNNLLLIGLWTIGVVLGPRFLLGTWIMYLICSFFTSLSGKAMDAVRDVVWLHYNGNLSKRLQITKKHNHLISA